MLIVSNAFAGISRLERHQKVLARVSDLVPFPIHALSIKALAPEEIFLSFHLTILHQKDCHSCISFPEFLPRSWLPPRCYRHAVALARTPRPRPRLRLPRRLPQGQGPLFAGNSIDFMVKQRTSPQGQADRPSCARPFATSSTRVSFSFVRPQAGSREKSDGEDGNGSDVADRSGTRVHGRLPEGASGSRRSAAQGIRCDQGPDRRQGIQGTAHPRRQ